MAKNAFLIKAVHQRPLYIKKSQTYFKNRIIKQTNYLLQPNVNSNQL